jgi:hypothetical protein
MILLAHCSVIGDNVFRTIQPINYSSLCHCVAQCARNVQVFLVQYNLRITLEFANAILLRREISSDTTVGAAWYSNTTTLFCFETVPIRVV